METGNEGSKNISILSEAFHSDAYHHGTPH
jgi:hypothetical protein